MRVLIALPVLNEETILRQTTETLLAFCAERMPEHEIVIVISDNGSTDGTEKIGRELAAAQGNVRYLKITECGKGCAIGAAWRSEEADAYAFMDVDLATDLAAFPELLRRIEDGADVAAGSRALAASVVDRSFGRRVFSWGYRTLLRAAFGTRIGDAPCGFKAVSPRVVREILPKTRDARWFFDTELLLLAEREGMRIDAVPVRWSDRSAPWRRSKVKAVPLAMAYAKHVFDLRRRMGPPPIPAFPGLRETLGSVTKWERGAVLAVACAATLLAAVPATYGVLRAQATNTEWTGRTIFSPGDTMVYLNQIAQARNGTFFFEDQATSEPVAGLANPFWYGVGLFSRWTGMSSLGAYTAVRLALVPFFVITAYAVIALLLSRPAARIVAFLTFLFGGGVGAFAVPFLSGRAEIGTFLWPVDLWVAEALPFPSILHSPHFVASWTLLLATLGLAFLALRTDRTKYAVAAGAAFLALASFHPFYAPTVLAVYGAYLCVETLVTGWRGRSWALFASIALMAAPAIAYHAWAVGTTENAMLYGMQQNLLLTPPFPYVLLGFGLPLIAACAASFFGGERDARRRFTATWFVTTVLLAYAPIYFQRRLLEGWFLPMAVLAAPVFLSAWEHARRSRAQKIALPALATFGAMLLFSAPVSATLRTVDAYRGGEAMFLMPADDAAALEWTRERTPLGARFLSGALTGNDILGLGERPVYAGHWSLTVDPMRKSAEAAAWYGSIADEARCAFLREHGIAFVWFGREERTIAPAFRAPSCLEDAFGSGEVTVYRVIR